MKRVVIEGLVAFILLVWSICNYIFFDSDDNLELKAARPYNSSYYHNDPLCPTCRTHMIYHFEFCPKCGQNLDWSEK